MTDTVNVPREAVECFKDALENMPDVFERHAKGQKFNAYDLDDDGGSKAVCIGPITSRPLSLFAAPADVAELVEAALKLAANALAAAPKAEPVSETVRLSLETANYLERIAEEADDNQWQDWAATMRQAAGQMRRLCSAQPKAPKVEKRPVGRVVSAHGDPEEFGEREIEVLRDLSGIPYNTPLYTQPEAPKVEQEPVAWLYSERVGNQRRELVSIRKNNISDEDRSEFEIIETPLYTHPAPAVEQEPVGWDHNYRQLGKGEIILASDEVQREDGSWHPCTCVGREAPDPSYTSHRVYRRLKRPAPASDELLEAARRVVSEAWTDRWGRLHNHPSVVALNDALAKHKGPQS